MFKLIETTQFKRDLKKVSTYSHHNKEHSVFIVKKRKAFFP